MHQYYFFIFALASWLVLGALSEGQWRRCGVNFGPNPLQPRPHSVGEYLSAQLKYANHFCHHLVLLFCQLRVIETDCNNAPDESFSCLLETCLANKRPLNQTFYFTNCQSCYGGKRYGYIWPTSFQYTVGQGLYELVVMAGKKSERFEGPRIKFAPRESFACASHQGSSVNTIRPAPSDIEPTLYVWEPNVSRRVSRPERSLL
ncbi:hypothetical protein O181_076640 [Austropuccinia psidii MF-1]|uniref:Uncharacterized protein n=1 Tax=Austropuccinia psidii MF-1 TaxID=1389203 RepID=A0A9Q3F945_9BASI|nr:hypothetical protein [Austropuccinia psidii MF-1]